MESVRTKRTSDRRRVSVVISGVTLVALIAGATASAQNRQPPADARAMSINLEDVPYPYPVSYLPLTMYGEVVRMAYMDVPPAGQPNGRTVVLLHGMNFFGEYWADTIEVLRNEGFRVVVPDQIGFGRSSKPLIRYSLHDMAANTRRILESLGIAQAAVVGHSMGGVVATRFAASNPDITSHLVIVNQIGLTDSRFQRPWRDIEVNLERSYEATRRGIERYFVNGFPPEMEKYVQIHWGWTLSGEWPRLARIRAELSRMMLEDPTTHDRPHVKAKTLILSGAEDGPNFRQLAREVADAIPNAELMLLDGVGHVPQVEAPDRFYPPFVRFLKSDPLPPPSARR